MLPKGYMTNTVKYVGTAVLIFLNIVSGSSGRGDYNDYKNSWKYRFIYRDIIFYIILLSICVFFDTFYKKG
jgi:hypothetical protein